LFELFHTFGNQTAFWALETKSELKKHAQKLRELSNCAAVQVSALEGNLQNLLTDQSFSITSYQKLCKSFSRWRNYTRKQIQFRRYEVKLLDRCQGFLTAWSWSCWTEMLHRRTSTYSRNVAIKASSLKIFCFQSWRENMLLALTARTSVSKSCNRWKSSCLYRYWVRWHMHSSDINRLRLVGKRIIKKWENRIYYAALMSWMKMAICSTKLKKSALCVLNRTSRLLLFNVWEAWGILSDKTRQRRQLVGKSIFKLQNILVVRIIHNWRLRVDGKSRMKKTISLVLERTLSTDSCRWVGAWASQVKRARKLMSCRNRVVLKTRNRLCMSSIMNWRNHADSLRNLRFTLKRYLSPEAFQVECRQHFWNLWAHRQTKILLLKRSMHSVLYKMQNKLLSLSFLKWKKVAHLLYRIKAVIFKGSMRSDLWTLRRLWKSWESNSSTVAFQRLCSIKMAERANQKLSILVLITWENQARHLCKVRSVILNACSQYRIQLLGEIVAVWASKAKSFVWMRRLLNKVDHSSKNKVFRSTWQAWQAFTLKRIQARNSLSSTIFKWRLLQLSRSWRGWTAHTDISQRIKILCSNFTARTQSNINRSFCSAWRQLCSRNHLLKLLSGKLALRCRSKGLKTWASYAVECQAAIGQAISTMTGISDISADTLFCFVAAAMKTWKETVRGARIFEITVQTLAAGRAKYLLGEAVRSWKFLCLSIQTLIEVAGRLFKRSCMKVSLLLLLAWHNGVQYCKWLQHTKSEVLRSYTKKMLLVSMVGWKMLSQEAHQRPVQPLVSQCVVSC
jgi:hypothetical protein